MGFVYIIRSTKDGSFYIGKTADPEKRLQWHNNLDLNTGVTRIKAPWEYFFVLQVDDMKVAGKIENHIKRMKGRTYILNLKKYPELGLRLIEKYS